MMRKHKFDRLDRSGGPYRGKTKLPWPARFWIRVNKRGPIPAACPKLGRCWLWMGSTILSGYGTVRDPATGKVTIASRLSFSMAYGPIPRELDACHYCDVENCVRPSHLFAATAMQNAQDAARKGRSGGAKLIPHQVREIRRRLRRGELQSKIAADYPINESIISRIHTFSIWKAA